MSIDQDRRLAEAMGLEIVAIDQGPGVVVKCDYAESRRFAPSLDIRDAMEAVDWLESLGWSWEFTRFHSVNGSWVKWARFSKSWVVGLLIAEGGGPDLQSAITSAVIRAVEAMKEWPQRIATLGDCINPDDGGS